MRERTTALFFVCAAAVAASCGTRTGLPIGESSAEGTPGDGNGGPLGGRDGGIDGSLGPSSGPPGSTGSSDGSAPDGCGDLSTSANCGVCGHDCGNGACVKGVCQPAMLTSDERFPTTIVADNDKVYWANVTDPDYGLPPASILVRAMPARGGTPTTLETIRPGFASSLHRDGQYLYFYRTIVWTIAGQPYEGTIVRLCADGSCKSQDLSGSIENRPWEIAIDSSRIFFPYSYGGGMSRIDKNGSAPVTMGILIGYYFVRLAVDDTYAYALASPNETIAQTQKPKLVRYKKTAGAAPEIIMDGLVESGDVQVDSDAIFVSNASVIYRLPKSGPNALKPTIIAQGRPKAFAMDAKRIYWLEYSQPVDGTPSSIHWVGKDGTGGGSLVFAGDATEPIDVALNDTALYWVMSIAPLAPPTPPRGGIMRMTKPL